MNRPPCHRHPRPCATVVRHDFCGVTCRQTISNSSSQALCLGSTACDGGARKSWMPGTRPGMTGETMGIAKRQPNSRLYHRQRSKISSKPWHSLDRQKTCRTAVALCLGSMTCDGGTKKVVDGRAKPDHDELETPVSLPIRAI